MRLCEIFNSDAPVSFLKTDTDAGEQYNFVSGNDKYAINFTVKGSAVIVGFAKIMGDKRVSYTSSTEKPFLVFSAIGQKIREWLSHNPSIDTIVFEGNSSENSRIKLYRTIIKKLASELHWQILPEVKKDIDESGRLMILFSVKKPNMIQKTKSRFLKMMPKFS